jgi:hypothetical protein
MYGTNQYAMENRAGGVTSEPRPYGTSAQKTSVTRRPDGTTTQTQESKTGENNMYQAPAPQQQTGSFQMPWQSQSASQAYQNMINSGGGMADTTAWMQSFAPQAQYTINNAINQAMQKGARTGMGNSMPLTRTQGDIAGQYWANLVPQFLQTQMQQQNIANQNYLNAAGGLGQQGQGALYGGMDWANNAFNLAAGYQGAQQGGLSNYQNELARMRPENNPYFQLAPQGFNAQNQVAPIQYNPSGFSRALDVGLGIASMGALGGAGSLNPTNWFRKTG